MLRERIELSTSPLPRECSTTELPQHLGKSGKNEAPQWGNQSTGLIVIPAPLRPGLREIKLTANAAAFATTFRKPQASNRDYFRVARNFSTGSAGAAFPLANPIVIASGMTESSRQSDPDSGGRKGGDRKQRLSEQLRANLARRKAQARARRAGDADDRNEGIEIVSDSVNKPSRTDVG